MSVPRADPAASHRPRERRLWRGRSVGLVIGVALACACAASPVAFGARGHEFENSFGTEGSGNGQFEEPSAVAVSQAIVDGATGDVYVADTGNNRVEWFKPKITGAYEYEGQFNGSGLFFNEEGTKAPEPLSLGLRDGLAIDNDPGSPSFGDVYVASGEFGHMVVDKFSATGVYIGQLTGVCAKAEEVPPCAGSELIPFSLITGLAVDASGKPWISEEHLVEGQGLVEGFDRFNDAEANELIPPFIGITGSLNGALKSGLAIDSEGDIYAGVFLGEGESPVVKFSSAGAVLDKKLDPESVTPLDGVATETQTNDVYVDNLTTVRRFAADGAELETIGEGHLLDACTGLLCPGGVAVDSVTGQVFVSDAPSDAIQVYELLPPSAPSVISESVSEITSESATLDAEVNPQSLGGEAETLYHFAYGECSTSSACLTSGYPKSTLPRSLRASFEVESLSAQVEGLSAGGTYHFKLIAQNEHGIQEGAEAVFTANGSGAFALPDDRRWEMVSPPEKNGSLVQSIGAEGPIQAAADGAAITYMTNAPTESEPRGNATGAQVLSKRGPGGWESRDLVLPHDAPIGIRSGQGEEYRDFSEDLSLAAVQPFGSFIALSPEASEPTAYLYEVQSSHYAPLVTGCPGEHQPCAPSIAEHANVPEGTVFGVSDPKAGRACPPELFCGPVFVGGTPDLSDVVLRSNVALTTTVPVAGEGGLYEWSGGKLTLISILPPDEEGIEVPAGGRVTLGLSHSSSSVDARGAISGDGSHIFWSDGEGSGSHLYMRDTATKKSVEIDVPEQQCLEAGECGEGEVDPEFQLATSDGKRVYFTDTQKLTSDGSAYAKPRGEGPNGGDLYLCEIEEDKCKLEDLAPAGIVLGSTLGAGEDGAWLYFVADGLLDNGGTPVTGAVHGKCPDEFPSVGYANDVCNLYVIHDGVTKLVALLSGADVPDWSRSLVGMTARVSPDGEWLAFMSQRPLTGYDNHDAISGRPDEEVYLYDGAAEQLACASCDPTGARPHGVEYAGGANMRLVGGSGEIWEESDWLAAQVPSWSPTTQSTSLYQSRYLSDSGRLFFDSSDALVSQDVNGTQDVYEYEPEGVGPKEAECGPAAASGSEALKPGGEFEVEGRHEHVGPGCVALISSGSSAQESAFLDASEDGSDVFFLTTAKLAPQDFDDAFDVYGAQECTSSAPCPTPPAQEATECGSEASCKAPVSPQPEIFGPSGTAALGGPSGNLVPANASKALTRAQKLAKALKACKRDRSKRKRAACEKQARRKYGAVAKAKRSNRNRRGG